ncbi:MAG: hypothetical protein S0880_06115, partial [Actinomycetota bacterium]|nr:hypothetical protein [Actinomycetota bacterium]
MLDHHAAAEAAGQRQPCVGGFAVTGGVSGNITIEEATPQELSELAAELEQYRDRLINETLSTAQRAK